MHVYCSHQALTYGMRVRFSMGLLHLNFIPGIMGTRVHISLVHFNFHSSLATLQGHLGGCHKCMSRCLDPCHVSRQSHLPHPLAHGKPMGRPTLTQLNPQGPGWGPPGGHQATQMSPGHLLWTHTSTTLGYGSNGYKALTHPIPLRRQAPIIRCCIHTASHAHLLLASCVSRQSPAAAWSLI